MQIKISSDRITLNVIIVSAVALLIQGPINAQGQAALRQAEKQQRRLEAQERREVALQRKQTLQQQRAVELSAKKAIEAKAIEAKANEAKANEQKEKPQAVKRAVVQPAVTANPALEQVYSQALTELETARADLMSGNHDYHGYRMQALARANDTIGQINEALKYYQTGTKAASVNAAAAKATRLNEAFARLGGGGPAAGASRSVESSQLPGGVAVKGVTASRGGAIQGKSSEELTSRLAEKSKGASGLEVDDPARDHFMPDALTALRQAQATLQGAGADTRGIHVRAVQQLNDASEMVIRGIEWQQIHRKLTAAIPKKHP